MRRLRQADDRSQARSKGNHDECDAWHERRDRDRNPDKLFTNACPAQGLEPPCPEGVLLEVHEGWNDCAEPPRRSEEREAARHGGALHETREILERRSELAALCDRAQDGPPRLGPRAGSVRSWGERAGKAGSATRGVADGGELLEPGRKERSAHPLRALDEDQRSEQECSGGDEERSQQDEHAVQEERSTGDGDGPDERGVGGALAQLSR